VADILHQICAFLHNDLGTLYSLSLCSRLYSSIALPALYASLATFPSNDDEDRLTSDYSAYAARLRKWSSLWRSLALSALNPKNTYLPYAKHLRILDLGDLLSLMDEFRSPRVATLRKAFFEGGLEECEKLRVFASGTFFDFNLSTDFLADIITRGTRNAIALIRQTPERPSADEAEGHLSRWLLNLPHLEFLQVFSAEVFEDERARDALTQCPKLRSLKLYLWAQAAAMGEAENEDTALSQLLSCIQGSGLERFLMKHGTSTFGQLSISALSYFHGKTLVELEILDISMAALTQFSLAREITNLRSCTLSYDSQVAPDAGNHEYVHILSSFLSSNTALRVLDIRLPLFQSIINGTLKNLHLNTLRITEIAKSVPETVIVPEFWKAISTQALCLEELHLPPPFISDNSLVEFSDLPTDMISAICSLSKLRVLGANGFTRYITDDDILSLGLHCSELEQLSVIAPNLTDTSLEGLCKLPKLKELVNQYVHPYRIHNKSFGG
jgi:hypothetical protein